MNKIFGQKRKIQKMIFKMIFVAFFLAAVTFLLGVLVMGIKNNNSDTLARAKNFTRVEAVTDEMVDSFSETPLTFQNIMSSYDWVSVPEEWIIDIYDSEDNLFFRHGDENDILATDMSVTKKITSHEGYYITVMLKVDEASAVMSGLPILASALIFAITFMVLFKRIGNYTDEIVNGIEILVAGDFDYKLPVKGNTELALLAEGINGLSEKYNQNIKAKELSDMARDELITNMAHDIKTPITVIEGYLSMLLNDENIDNEKRQEYTGIALNKCNELNDRANGIFEYVKLSETTNEDTFGEVHANKYISERYEEMAMVMFSEGFKCEVDITVSPIITIKIDEAKLNRVFDNMLSNILKYADESKPVKLSAQVKREYIELCMENTTKEKSDIDSEKLFERMVSGDRSRSNKSSGLGLSICKLIIEMHEGEISADVIEENIKFTIMLKI